MALPTDVRALFPFPPDWKSPVEESFEFKSDVLRSRDQTGQWRGLRSKPREQVQYRVQLSGDDAARFDYRMRHSQPYTWLLPQWTRINYLANEVLTAATELTLSKPVSHLAAAGDEYVIVSSDPSVEPEMVTVDTVSEDRLTLNLAVGLTNDWSEGVTIYPAWRCLIASEVSAEWLTSKVVQSQFVFRRLATNLPPIQSSLVADASLDGMEVLTRRLNWVRSLAGSYQWLPDYIDSGIGPFGSLVKGIQTGQIRQGEVLCKSRDEVDWWLAFFHRRSGRRVPFKMPTWLGDLPLHDPINLTADFEVTTEDLGRYAPSTDVYSHLMIVSQDGTNLFFKISSFIPDFNNKVTIIETVESWGEIYNPWECRMSCLVTNAHLASDMLNVTWLTDEVARITIAVSAEVVA